MNLKILQQETTKGIYSETLTDFVCWVKNPHTTPFLKDIIKLDGIPSTINEKCTSVWHCISSFEGTSYTMLPDTATSSFISHCFTSSF